MDGDLNAPIGPQGPGTTPPQQPMQPTQPPTTPEPTPDQMPEKPKSSSGLIIGIIITIILVLAGAGGYYYYVTYMKKAATTTPTTTPVYSSTNSSQSPIQSDYDQVTAATPATEKSKAVDAIFQPILKKVFTDNVKLKEEFGPMMTYVVNRKITAADVTSTQTELTAVGYKTIDSSAKIITVSKGAYTWVITFSVDNDNKATIDITF